MLIKDIPFEPEYTPEALQLAKDWLVGNKKKFAYTANFCFVNDDGVQPFVNQPCHNQITNGQIKPGRCLVATENAWSRNSHTPRTKEQIEPFLKWLLNESHFSRFIVNRDDFEFCRDYGFIVSTDVYTPLLQNIMITTRHFYEIYLQSFVKFNELVANGVDGELAYMFTMLTGWSMNNQPNHALNSYGGHRAYNLPRDVDGFKRMMLGDINSVSEKALSDKSLHCRNNRNYLGGHSLFSPYTTYYCRNHFLKDLLTKDEDFRKGLQKCRGKDDGDVYTPPNPFVPRPRSGGSAGVPTDPSDFTYKEVWEYVIPYLMETKLWLK